MTARHSNPRSGENVSDESTDNSDEVPPPIRAKESIAGVDASVQARTSVEQIIEVMGNAGLNQEPVVFFTFKEDNQGKSDTSFVFQIPPERARELGRMLLQQADYAERYAEYKRAEMDQ